MKVKNGSAQETTFITSYSEHVKHDVPREEGKTRRSKDGSFTRITVKRFSDKRDILLLMIIFLFQ